MKRACAVQPGKQRRGVSLCLYLVVRYGLVILVLAANADGVSASDYDRLRAGMVEEIEQNVRFTQGALGKDTLARRVAAAIGSVPRHEFVPESQRADAYVNRPLPIGFGQTISQPYIVAIMTDLLQPEPDDVVFELGTGSGYQAAVLASLVREVYSVEIIEHLGIRARSTLKRLGFENVEVRIGDGYNGWSEHAPFDGIVVTAAGDHIPPPLIMQLKRGGRMVIPVGSRFFTQQLMVIEKDEDGTVRSRGMLPVRFVPLTGGH